MHLQVMPQGDDFVIMTRSADPGTHTQARGSSITVQRHQLPLTINYDNKTYILVLTRSNKLLLQKPL
ncbi:MAG TPA: hypothetical protein VIU41_00330 [Geobacteraceae bacterium]